MTPEEINEINRQIATWLGWKEIYQENTALIGIPPYMATEAMVFDYYTSDSDAVTLLPAIARHPNAYYWKAHYNPFNKTNTFEIYHNALKCATAFDKQFSAAICQAVIQVIRKEKEQ